MYTVHVFMYNEHVFMYTTWIYVQCTCIYVQCTGIYVHCTCIYVHCTCINVHCTCILDCVRNGTRCTWRVEHSLFIRSRSVKIIINLSPGSIFNLAYMILSLSRNGRESVHKNVATLTISLGRYTFLYRPVEICSFLYQSYQL